MSAPVNQVLQQALNQQFRPISMPSSAFTDTSSIYVNSTPRRGAHLGGGALRSGPVSTINANNSTFYAGATDLEKELMLQSSL